MAALQELYNAKAADKSKSGKAAFSKWRMDHAHAHLSIQPGPHGKPMFHHDFQDQILDPLHLSELGVPKAPWKYGVLNNCSDDAREDIGGYRRTPQALQAPSGHATKGRQPVPCPKVVHRRGLGELPSW